MFSSDRSLLDWRTCPGRSRSFRRQLKLPLLPPGFSAPQPLFHPGDIVRPLGVFSARRETLAQIFKVSCIARAGSRHRSQDGKKFRDRALFDKQFVILVEFAEGQVGIEPPPDCRTGCDADLDRQIKCGKFPATIFRADQPTNFRSLLSMFDQVGASVTGD
jgi:hypothetical protein